MKRLSPTLTAQKDSYPSRIEGPGQIIPREEPVVYGADTGDAGPLDQSQLEQYESWGYLFFPSFFNETEVAALQDELEEIRNSEQVRQSELAVTEPTSGDVRSVFAVQTISKFLRKLISERRLLSIAHQILGSEVYLHQSRVDFKPGFRGKEFYWHSDFETWHAEDGMPRMRALSCSVALTENRASNGPLMLIPGSHRHFCQCTGDTPDQHYLQSLRRQNYGVPSDDQLLWLTSRQEPEIPCGPAGSVLFFDSNVMHGSNGNITPYPRSNVFFVYNSIENPLQDPFCGQEPRPWYLGNREPEILEPVDWSAETLTRSSSD